MNDGSGRNYEILESGPKEPKVILLMKKRKLRVGFEEMKQLWDVFLQVKLHSLSQHWRKGVSKDYNCPLLIPSLISTMNIYLVLCSADAKTNRLRTW